MIAHRLTVESVLEATTSGEDGAIHLFGGEDAVQDQVEQVVAKHSSSGLQTEKTVGSIFRPSNLKLEALDRKGLGAQQGGGRAARDVVADKGEEVDEDGEAKRDSKGTDTRKKKNPRLEIGNAMRRRCWTYGPPNS